MLNHLWDSKYGIITGLLESLFKKYFLSACFALDTLLVTGERETETNLCSQENYRRIRGHEINKSALLI